MKFMDYVKATTIEETALEYQNKGYKVIVSPIDVSYSFETKPQSYDLIATKGERKIAFEVVAFPKLAQEVRKIAELRLQARSEGFDEFRVVVVREPRQYPVNIKGIEQELSHYLVENITPELAELSDQVRTKTVKRVTIDSFSITVDGIRVAGHGIVIVDIYYNEDGERFWEDDDFPLYFDVELDHRLKLKHVHKIEASTWHFWQYSQESE
ncbi:MAG: hypothetical protein ACPGWR_24365 [Ardenticatenaceae bacterium]